MINGIPLSILLKRAALNLAAITLVAGIFAIKTQETGPEQSRTATEKSAQRIVIMNESL